MSKELLDAVKKAALSAIFSQGVKLAREGAVLAERQGAATEVLRVRAPGRAAYLTVTLYFGDLEWTCDCMGPTDPCAHVVAAAIAVHQARRTRRRGAGRGARRARSSGTCFAGFRMAI